MKQRLITKERIDEKENKKAVEEKIKELKKLYHKRTFESVSGLYEILSKIVGLRRSYNKHYMPRSLEWEKDIKITAMQIRYIFSYRYISEYGKKKVAEGKIYDSTICHFLAVSSLLRESQWQNRLIDMIIEKKLRISRVSELTTEELKEFLLGRLKIRKDDEYFITATKTLRSIKKRIHERKELIKSSPYSRNLINAINQLHEEIMGELTK